MKILEYLVIAIFFGAIVAVLWAILFGGVVVANNVIKGDLNTMGSFWVAYFLLLGFGVLVYPRRKSRRIQRQSVDNFRPEEAERRINENR